MPALILAGDGSRITFEASGGSAVLTLTSLASGAGRISAVISKSAGSREKFFNGALRTQLQSGLLAGEFIRIYIFELVEARVGGSPAFLMPGDLPSTDSAISDEQRFIAAGGVLIATLEVPPSPAADTQYVSSTMDYESRAEEYSMGVWNATSAAFTATASEHELYTQDVDDESQ